MKKLLMMINMWVVFWYSFSYFSISTAAGRVVIESKAPVPPSASSCTHIGVGGNQGDRRPCPPSFAISSGDTGHLEAGSISSNSSSSSPSRSTGLSTSTSSHEYGIGLPMGKGPVPPSSASSCTHIGVGGNQGDRRPCPPSFAISSGDTGHLEAGSISNPSSSSSNSSSSSPSRSTGRSTSTSSHEYGIGLPMGKGPVPPSSASSCTHIGVGGNQGDRRPCPPSFATSSGTTGHLEAGSTLKPAAPAAPAAAPTAPAASTASPAPAAQHPSSSPRRSSSSSQKYGIGLLMGQAPLPPSASSCTHVGEAINVTTVYALLLLLLNLYTCSCR